MGRPLGCGAGLDPAAVAAHLEAAAADTGYAARAARLLDEPEDAAPDRAAAALEGLLSAAPAPADRLRRLTPEQRRLLAQRLSSAAVERGADVPPGVVDAGLQGP